MFDLMPPRRRPGKEIDSLRGEMIRRCSVKEIKDNKQTRSGVEQSVRHEDKRDKDRREASCEGYTYISTVGWICRREIIRRKDLPRPH